MVDFVIEAFGDFSSNIHSVYKQDVHKLIDLRLSQEKVPNLIFNDFYKLGLTPSINRIKHSIPELANYRILGKSTFDNIPRMSLVSLLTFDFKYIKSTCTDSDGNYFFDFLLNQDYVIVAEDLSSEYNHSIQVGVKPVEIV